MDFKILRECIVSALVYQGKADVNFNTLHTTGLLKLKPPKQLKLELTVQKSSKTNAMLVNTFRSCCDVFFSFYMQFRSLFLFLHLFHILQIGKDPDVRQEALFVLGETMPLQVAKSGKSVMPYNHQAKYFPFCKLSLLILFRSILVFYSREKEKCEIFFFSVA